MKNILIGVVVLIIIGVGTYFFTNSLKVEKTPEVVVPEATTPTVEEPKEVTQTEPVAVKKRDQVEIIGTSADNHDITAYHYGNGEKELLFVGGIHGGYSWNTALVAYELMDYLEKNPTAVPENITVTVVPVLNPDGLQKVVGTTAKFSASDVVATNEERVEGRFNANNVDLNRNFDCKWEAKGVWQDKTVSGGTSPFSEPESKAIRDYVLKNKPTAVVAWYSAAGGVYASNCENGVLPETDTITKLYSKASGYPAYEEFDFYKITGDMVNWLALNKIPAISVLLTDHKSTEWTKNLAGVKALISHYTE